MILQKKGAHFLFFVVVFTALSIIAERCRLLVGEQAASKSGSFTFLDCFDGSSGSLACSVKEGVKLYCYNIRSAHVESKRYQAVEVALADAVAQGLDAKKAAKLANKEGAKAAKLATRKANRIIGPVISSAWDFFEAIYFGGDVTEGFLRGTGTLFGTYYVGFLGEVRFGRIGYLVGSHLGSWVGGRIGLMIYDVVNGISYLMQSLHTEAKVYGDPSNNQIFTPDDLTKSVMAEESYMNEPTWTSNSAESQNRETPAEERFDGPEEF